MPGSIVGPRAKLRRATEHKAELDDAIDQWFDSAPYGVFGAEVQGWFEVRIREHEPPPIRLGTIFGDFVSNLESALDLLVYQLVIASGNEPGTGNYFPVVTDKTRWPTVARDKLRGLRGDLADRLKPTQPFGENPERSDHPLLVIHTANKISKHNVVPPGVIYDFAIRPQFSLNRPAQRGESVVNDPTVAAPAVGSKLFDDQLLGRLRGVSPGGDLRITGIVGMHPGDIGIAFDLPPLKQPGPPRDLIEYVAEVISAFEDILEGEDRPRVRRYPPGRFDPP